MTHDQVKTLLNDYFDAKLSLETNRAIEIHLSECPECSQYLFSLQDLLKHAEKLPRKIKPDREFWNDIFAAVSSIKDESIKQKEEIDSIEAERLSKLDGEKQKKNKKLADARKILEKERRKAAFKEKINKPIYVYSLLGIVFLVILYFAYNFLFSKSGPWQVYSIKIENGYTEETAKLYDEGFAETGAANRLELKVPEIGSIILGPNTKIQRLSTNTIILLKGEITANKEEAKKLLSVQAAGVTILDFFLGGNYKLTLNNNNHLKLLVNDGWVSVNKNQLESRVIPNHICEVMGDSGLGVPYNVSSSGDFVNAVNNYSFLSSGSEESLISLLSKASASNAVTLWNLLTRTSLKQREMVMFTMFNLIGQPYEVTDEGLKMLKKDILQKYLEDIETKI